MPYRNKVVDEIERRCESLVNAVAKSHVPTLGDEAKAEFADQLLRYIEQATKPVKKEATEAEPENAWDAGIPNDLTDE